MHMHVIVLFTYGFFIYQSVRIFQCNWLDRTSSVKGTYQTQSEIQRKITIIVIDYKLVKNNSKVKLY